MLSIEPLGLDPAMLDEARAYLRVDAVEEDASLGAVLLAAAAHAENYTGQMLIRRTARAMFSAGSGWQTLPAFPVVSITGVLGIPAEGAAFALSPSAWEAKVGSRGKAYFRVLQPGSAGRVEVACLAGLSPGWASLPEALRLGVLRLAGYFHRHRDGGGDSVPPAAALALLLPWRRVRLG